MTSNDSEYIGRTVLVGINSCDESGKNISFRDLFGTIQSIDKAKGILLKLPDGGEYNLPPFELDEYVAKHDQYKMQSQDMMVVIVFDVVPPQKH